MAQEEEIKLHDEAFLREFKRLVDGISAAKCRGDLLRVGIEATGWGLLPTAVFSDTTGHMKSFPQLKQKTEDILRGYVRTTLYRDALSNMLLANLVTAKERSQVLKSRFLSETVRGAEELVAETQQSLSWFAKTFGVGRIEMEQFRVEDVRIAVFRSMNQRGKQPPLSWFVDPSTCQPFRSALDMISWIFALRQPVE